jgi:hypothetical protein
MWTSKNRARYDRSKLRYPSDLSDDEWGLVEPLIPPGKTGGGKRTVVMREVVNGGVGKTTIARTLMDYFTSKAIEHRAFDTKPLMVS